MRKPKLFNGDRGDAIGLRDCLIEHFERMATAERGQLRGDDYASGITAGRAYAFSDAAMFLKKLVNENDEHPEADNEPV